MYGSVGFGKKSNLQQWLVRSPAMMVFVVSLSAFVLYTCMYGFRKPYTAAAYNDFHFLGISYKVCLVIAQVLGYMTSKFYGIRFIAAMKPEKRIRSILLAIGIAWLSLLLFAIIPPPFNIICLFINGLPLGLIYGLVFGFLEGRKTTEIMGAFLATSFIFASGLAKTAGKWLLLDLRISEWWMPFVAGSFFIVPLLIAAGVLRHTPPPTAGDIALRTIRNPMTRPERKAFLQQFGRAILPVVVAYAAFTITRDFMEDFANELWAETGYRNNAGIFARTGTIISLIVLLLIAAFYTVKNNTIAFKLAHYAVIIGVLTTALATALFNQQFISPLIWMIVAGTGLYLAYIPFNCLYFERLISVYRVRGNFGFVMYIADAFGYLGTVVVLLVKEFIPIRYSWVDFFSCLFYTTGITGLILMIVALRMHGVLIKKLKKDI